MATDMSDIKISDGAAAELFKLTLQANEEILRGSALLESQVREGAGGRNKCSYNTMYSH